MPSPPDNPYESPKAPLSPAASRRRWFEIPATVRLSRIRFWLGNAAFWALMLAMWIWIVRDGPTWMRYIMGFNTCCCLYNGIRDAVRLKIANRSRTADKQLAWNDWIIVLPIRSIFWIAMGVSALGAVFAAIAQAFGLRIQ